MSIQQTYGSLVGIVLTGHSAPEQQRRSVCQSHSSRRLLCQSVPHLGRNAEHFQLDCKLCLGTMQFGELLSKDDSYAQLELAWEAGVRAFDTAEMYPVPQHTETQGLSESILGRWLTTKHRDAVVVATKVAGPGQMLWLREGPKALDARNIAAAIDGSLLRLNIDYIDLLQLHWPDRYFENQLKPTVDYDPASAYSSTPLEEQLEAVGRAVAAGKVLSCGLSNETPWGVMEASRLAKLQPAQCPAVSTVQNAYSLTCRTFDMALAECCHREGIGLLAYSPLAMGLLTGKYSTPAGGPPGARLNRYKGRYAEAESRYGCKPNSREAVEAYVDLARQSGITACHMALRFVLSHPLLTAAVVGASDCSQLEHLLAGAAEGPLAPDVLEAIDAVHRRYPNPTP